jgi:hypothetical protein
MVDVSLIQPVSQVAAAIGVCIAAIYYVLNLRISQKNQELSLKAQQQSAETRQAQLLMQIFNMINHKEFQRDWMEMLWSWKWVDYNDYLEKAGTNPEKVAQLNHVLGTFEGIGVLLENNLVDLKMLSKMVTWGPILTWEKYGPIMKEYGRRTGEPKMYPGFEFLYNELSRMYEVEHGYKYGHKVRSMDDALSSIKSES